MFHRLVHAFVVLMAAAAFGFAAQAQQPQSQARFAFVIGNDGYEGAEMPTAANDAALVAEMLKSAGFDVTGARNLDQDTLRASYREFLEKVAAGGPESVAFLYVSGYGIQAGGENFIIPPDSRITRAADLALNGIRLSDITRALGGLPAQGRIMVFDLAYASPFAQEGQALSPGLARMDAGPGDLIAFNAEPGAVAPMGEPPYGAYAQAIAEMAREPGVPIDEVFDRVRQSVADMTNGAQAPWTDSRIGPIVLFEPRPNVARPAARWTPPPPPQYVEDSHYYLPLPAAEPAPWIAPPVYVVEPPEPVVILPPEPGYVISPYVAAPVALAAAVAAGTIIYRRDWRARPGVRPGRRFLPPVAAAPRGRPRQLPAALQPQNLQNFRQRPRPVNNQQRFQPGQQRFQPGQQRFQPGQQGFQPGQQGSRPGRQLPNLNHQGGRPGQQGFGQGAPTPPQQMRQQQQMLRQQQRQQQQQMQQQRGQQMQQQRQQQMQQQRQQQMQQQRGQQMQQQRQQQMQQQMQQQRQQQMQQQRGQQMQQQRQQQMQQQRQQQMQQQRQQQMQQQRQQQMQQQRQRQMQQQRQQQMQQQRQQQMQQQRQRQMQQQRQQQMQQQRQQQMQQQRQRQMQQQRRNCVRGTPGCP